MALVNTYKCDVCGALKRETNNWFVVSTPLARTEVTVLPFSSSERDLDGSIHCCGADCLSKAVMRWAGKYTAAGTETNEHL